MSHAGHVTVCNYKHINFVICKISHRKIETTIDAQKFSCIDTPRVQNHVQNGAFAAGESRGCHCMQQLRRNMTVHVEKNEKRDNTTRAQFH